MAFAMKPNRIGTPIAVVGLSVLVGSGWLLIEAYPSKIGFPFAGFVHFAVITLAGLVAAPWKTWAWKKTAVLAALGIGLFVLPGVVGQLTQGAVSGSASIAIFCAVPLMMVLGKTWFGRGDWHGLMMPGLIGLSGALLLFSVELPRSWRDGMGLAAVLASCAGVAWASVYFFERLRKVRISVMVSVVGAAGAVTMGVYGVALGWPQMTLHAVSIEALRCLAFDLPVVWITVWLMRKVPPIKLAARFLIIPVVTWVEGYAMVRGAVELRSMVALALMMAGAGMLMAMRGAEDMPGLGLR